MAKRRTLRQTNISIFGKEDKLSSQFLTYVAGSIDKIANAEVHVIGAQSFRNYLL